MNIGKSRTAAILLGVVLGLGGCQCFEGGMQPQVTVGEEYTQPLSESKRRELNWFLEMGEYALKADRLTTPADDNAYTWYKRALAISPQDKDAQRGMNMISERYQQFARKVAEQGLIVKAEQYLQKAKMAALAHENMNATEAFIELMRESDIRTYRLADDALSVRASAIKDKLHSIGRHAFELKAKVLIVARNDKEGRWIYQQMQEASQDSRLRANLQTGKKPFVQLRIDP